MILVAIFNGEHYFNVTGYQNDLQEKLKISSHFVFNTSSKMCQSFLFMPEEAVYVLNAKFNVNEDIPHHIHHWSSDLEQDYTPKPLLGFFEPFHLSNRKNMKIFYTNDKQCVYSWWKYHFRVDLRFSCLQKLR